MIEYLGGHFRYHTMNSWNCATSYARCVKLSYIDFPDKATENVAYDIVCSDSNWMWESGIKRIINDFDVSYGHSWQIGTNGRSGGYMVLYQGFREPSGYRSYCENCGQQNFKAVIEWPANPTPQDILTRYVVEHNSWIPRVYLEQSEVKALNLPDSEVLRIVQATRDKYQGGEHRSMWVTFDNVCGACGSDSRVNYETTHMRVGCWPGKGVDDDCNDFTEWDTGDLRSRTELVWDFDRTVNACIKAFVEYCKDARVVEEEVLVPQTRRVVQHA